MNNKLKITTMRQLKALSYFIFHIFLYVAIFVYLKFDTDFFVIFGPMAVFLVLPAMFLHIEYYLRNKNEEYELCHDKIIRRKDNIEDIYNKEDINKIEVNVSPNYYRSNIYVTAFENYHFAKVYLVSGEILYITSLLAPGDIDKAFSLYLKEIPFRRIKRIFATTLY